VQIHLIAPALSLANRAKLDRLSDDCRSRDDNYLSKYISDQCVFPVRFRLVFVSAPIQYIAQGKPIGTPVNWCDESIEAGQNERRKKSSRSSTTSEGTCGRQSGPATAVPDCRDFMHMMLCFLYPSEMNTVNSGCTRFQRAQRPGDTRQEIRLCQPTTRPTNAVCVVRFNREPARGAGLSNTFAGDRFKSIGF